MTDMFVREQAFQRIQNNPDMYHEWVHAKTQTERDDIMLMVAFDLGYETAEREYRDGD